MTEATLSVRVVSPAATVFEGSATAVVIPAWDGEVGILPRHAPMIALLGRGRLVVTSTDRTSDQFWVAGGVFKVLDDVVTVLTEYASNEPPDESAAAETGWGQGTTAQSLS